MIMAIQHITCRTYLHKYIHKYIFVFVFIFVSAFVFVLPLCMLIDLHVQFLCSTEFAFNIERVCRRKSLTTKF